MTQARSQDDRQAQATEQLLAELQRLNEHRFVTIHNSLWRLVLFQLIRGMAFGLGTVLGATLLVSLIGWWVAQIEFIPILGDWLAELVAQMESGT